MGRASLWRKAQVWYRFARYHARGLRRVCISILSIVLVADRVIERARELLTHLMHL
jgi:hypothetical protein